MLWLYISPLEHMGRLLRAGKTVQLEYMEGLLHRRYYLPLLAILVAAPLAVQILSTGFIYNTYNHVSSIDEAFECVGMRQVCGTPRQRASRKRYFVAVV